MRIAFLVGCLLLGSLSTGGVLSQSLEPAESYQKVDMGALRRAMEAELSEDYTATATTNVARFFSGVMFRLIDEMKERNPDGPPIFISHRDWYRLYEETANLDRDNLPIQVKKALEHRQDVLVDYAAGAVIASIEEGPVPKTAMSVQIGWPDSAKDLPDKYSFKDTLSTPELQVTNHRLIRYRLVDFGDMILFDEMEGVTGRPNSGVLAAIFKLIGEGKVVWSRIAVAEDGIQIARGQAKKGPFGATETIHVLPSGVGEKGLPARTEEYLNIDDRLRQDIDIEYHDWRLPDFD